MTHTLDQLGFRLARVRLVAALALLALALAACGSAANAGSGQYGYSSGSPTAGAAPTAAPGASGAASPSAGTGYDYGAPAGPSSATSPSATAQPGDGGAAVGASTPSSTNPDAQRYTIVPGESRATYHARQRVFVSGIAPAVDGSTNDVTGTIVVDPQHPSRSEVGTIAVHVDKLASGIDLRDQRLKGQYLESSKFPIATFKTTRQENLPDKAYTDGEEVRFKIIGDLTVHGVTREVTFDATGKIAGDTLTSTAKTTIRMSDFGIAVPDLANFVKAENDVGLELSITARRG